ncbi:MAG TPA: cbb3-type cytochrome oxidase assembly protein CcoS [Chthoniobacterales bacterium]
MDAGLLLLLAGLLFLSGSAFAAFCWAAREGQFADLQQSAGEILRDPVQERHEVDQSVRLPVLVFLSSAIFWLLMGSLLGLVSAIKMTHPGFLDDAGWLTFGRLRPAHLNAMVYGWASGAGIGVGIWLLARLCHAALRWDGLLLAAAGVWNLGVLVGTAGILRGDSRGIEWLEFPGYATPFLFVAWGGIAIWAAFLLRHRRRGHLYVSAWYLLAAFLWFPWLYATANLLLIWQPVAGPAQAAVNWWFAHNILGLWFTPLGLAAAFYLIPKVIGEPIHSYYLSLLGFWSLALFYSWNGMHHLIGGPFPAWMVSASVVASLMMFVPVITVAINHHSTLRGHFGALRWSPTLRFVVLGSMAYTLVSFQGSLLAIPAVNGVLHFTDFTPAHAHLGMYGFFTMVMFGSVYYLLPRLVGWEWPSAGLIRWHFWLSAGGIALMFVSLTLGGIGQGMILNDPAIPFLTTLGWVWPFRMARSLSGLLLFAGHLIFALHFGLMLRKYGPERDAPTLLANPEAAA